MRLFQRSCYKLGVLNGTVVSCGRDASTAVESEESGLDEGVKGWELDWDKAKEGGQTAEADGAREDAGGGQETDQGVFSIGSPTVQARGLVVLKDKIVISVIRGGAWVIEVWTNV